MKLQSCMILFLLVFPASLCARTEEWVRLAEHDLAFARALSSDGVRFGPDFREQIIADRIWKCKPRRSKLAGLEPVQVRQVNQYCESYCTPWHSTWAKAVSPCDRDLFVPTWCLEGNEHLAAQHLGFAPYFETLTAAIRASNDQLLRYNVMAVIADRLDTNDLRDFPLNVTEPWVTAAASSYLERATPDDAIAIAGLLSYTQFGPSPALASTFEAFVSKSGTATQNQRSDAAKIVRRLRGETVEQDETAATPGSRATVRPLRNAETVEVPSPEKVKLLVQRIDQYYTLMREGRYEDSYGLVATDYRETVADKDEWVYTCRHFERFGRIMSWRIDDIRVSGTRARVMVDVLKSEKKRLLRSEQKREQERQFWIFENANWCYTVESIHDWRDDQSVEVPVPMESSR